MHTYVFILLAGEYVVVEIVVLGIEERRLGLDAGGTVFAHLDVEYLVAVEVEIVGRLVGADHVAVENETVGGGHLAHVDILGEHIAERLVAHHREPQATLAALFGLQRDDDAIGGAQVRLVVLVLVRLVASVDELHAFGLRRAAIAHTVDDVVHFELHTRRRVAHAYDALLEHQHDLVGLRVLHTRHILEYDLELVIL